MAVDLSKFKKKVEKRLPILFLVEENEQNVLSAHLVDGILNDCLKKNIHTEFMLFSFGLDWTLKFPKLNNNVPHFANLESIALNDVWSIVRSISTSSQTFLGSALELCKAILDDPETTKSDRYKPVVIIIASRTPAKGWEERFDDLLNNGRSSNAQVYWISTTESSIFAAFTLLDVSRPEKSKSPLKKYEKVIYKNISSDVATNLISQNASEIVSSFKLEPFDEVSAEDPVEFTTPGFNGEFGDGSEAKGDGVV